MAGFGDLVQKAFYLGVGAASLAAEKANELKQQASKLADEMVERGEMNADEAKKFVDDIVKNAQQKTVSSPEEPHKEPRRIEILDDEEEETSTTQSTSAEEPNVDNLREQVKSLQEELQRLKHN